ncbi:sohB protease domain protein [Orientia tsutsugamushi str. UT76]|nr:sohB protease domain protein [Orientia tsutsugamushi str. UT76]
MEIISKNHTNSLDKAILRQPASKIDNYYLAYIAVC